MKDNRRFSALARMFTLTNQMIGTLTYLCSWMRQDCSEVRALQLRESSAQTLILNSLPMIENISRTSARLA